MSKTVKHNDSLNFRFNYGDDSVTSAMFGGSWVKINVLPCNIFQNEKAQQTTSDILLSALMQQSNLNGGQSGYFSQNHPLMLLLMTAEWSAVSSIEPPDTTHAAWRHLWALYAAVHDWHWHLLGGIISAHKSNLNCRKYYQKPHCRGGQVDGNSNFGRSTPACTIKMSYDVG